MGMPGGRARGDVSLGGRGVAEDLKRAGTRLRTFAALGGDLHGFGINVPTPQTHAGRVANKAVARLMWAKKPIKIRWHSPTGQEPFAWRIYAAPRARQNVLDVLRDVIGEVGQGNVSVQVHQDTTPGVYPDEAWYVELLPAELQAPQGDVPLQTRGNLGMPAALSWAPKRFSDFGPRRWRSAGRPSVPGYGDAAIEPAPPAPPTAGTRTTGPDPADTAERRAIRGIIHAFRMRGEAAGTARADRLGARFAAGARAWVAHRADTEEQLATAVASVRARLVRHRAQHAGGCVSCEKDEIVLAFLGERLEELRAAKRGSHTPGQAVADRAEVPTVAIPRWVTYSMLAIAVLSAVTALGGRKAAERQAA